MAEADLRALLELHVEKYNEAVRTSDFAPLLAMYADNAVLSFDDLPLGPFHGRSEIRAAYSRRPPDDTMWLIDMHEVGDDAVTASFEWEAGGTGEMYLRWDGGRVVEHRIKALNVVDLGEKGLP